MDLARRVADGDQPTMDEGLPPIISEIEWALARDLVGGDLGQLDIPSIGSWLDDETSDFDQLLGIWLLNSDSVEPWRARLVERVEVDCGAQVASSGEKPDFPNLYALSLVSKWLGHPRCGIVDSLDRIHWTVLIEELGRIASGGDPWQAVLNLDAAEWTVSLGEAPQSLLDEMEAAAASASLANFGQSVELTDVAKLILTSPRLRELPVAEDLESLVVNDIEDVAYSRIIQIPPRDAAQSFALVEARRLLGVPTLIQSTREIELTVLERWVLGASGVEIDRLPSAVELASVSEMEWDTLGFLREFISARYAVAPNTGCDFVSVGPAPHHRVSRRAAEVLRTECGLEFDDAEFFTSSSVAVEERHDYAGAMEMLDTCDSTMARDVTDDEIPLGALDAVGLWSLLVISRVADGECEEILNGE